MHSCWATAHSGVPPLYPLFNGSICKHAHSFATLFDSAIEKPYDEHLQVAPPIVLPAPLAGGGFRRGAGLAIFLNSHGEMTALDGHGERIWQVHYLSLAISILFLATELDHVVCKADTLMSFEMGSGFDKTLTRFEFPRVTAHSEARKTSAEFYDLLSLLFLGKTSQASACVSVISSN